MEKVYIISVFNKHEDFIKLQYDSILKHVKGEYEYIIFNNASDEIQANKIKDICDDLNIQSYRIKVDYNMGPSDIAGEALNQSFNHLSDKLVFKIDSDMFFISDIELTKICNNYDLFYIETQNKFMWSAVFSINMKKVKNIKLNFRPHVIPNTDTFGQSCLLTENSEYTRKKMFLYCILTDVNNEINGLINNDCRITLNNYNLTFNENFLYEDLFEKLPNKYSKISKTMVDYNFPHPYHIDFITLDDVDVIIHFKSSNHDNIYRNLEYTENKKNSINKIFK
jgi:hypothetical protein